MRYGITGNTGKEKLWHPVADLTAWFMQHDIPFCMTRSVAEGLVARDLLARHVCDAHTTEDLAGTADVILSFGGDGTMLNSAREVGRRGTPILGVNIGRLGFLADIEVGQLQETIQQLERGAYRIEERMVLSATVTSDEEEETYWALNEFVLERSGRAGLLSIHVQADGVELNEYWADGLIIATPTGSTAYSLSVGGPIVAPGCNVMILTPLAPHSLTVRPIVVPDHAVLEAHVVDPQQPYVLAADGQSRAFTGDHVRFTFRRAAHTVNLVKLPDQHYFQTIRSKLMWGVLRHG